MGRDLKVCPDTITEWALGQGELPLDNPSSERPLPWSTIATKASLHARSWTDTGLIQLRDKPAQEGDFSPSLLDGLSTITSSCDGLAAFCAGVVQRIAFERVAAIVNPETSACKPAFRSEGRHRILGAFSSGGCRAVVLNKQRPIGGKRWLALNPTSRRDHSDLPHFHFSQSKTEISVRANCGASRSHRSN
jgi:hypothetical protein